MGTVITFYSYKGGVGRTMTLANVAALLARYGRKVLCIDWDLEAPGLDLYLRRWLAAPADKAGPSTGLIEALLAFRDGADALPWADHLTPVEIPDVPGRLDLLAAGGRDEDYEARLHQIDWPTLYEKYGLGAALEQARAEWMETYDVILLDSRTGVSDIGGVCTVQLPDVLVLLGTANQQNLDGLTRVLAQVDAQRKSFDVERGRIVAVPVLSRFERQAEYEESERWLGRYVAAFAEAVRQWVSKEVPVKRVMSALSVPYIPYWSFGERMPVIDKGTDDDTDLGWHFETLARLLDGGLGDAGALLTARFGWDDKAWGQVAQTLAAVDAVQKPRVPDAIGTPRVSIDRDLGPREMVLKYLRQFDLELQAYGQRVDEMAKRLPPGDLSPKKP